MQTEDYVNNESKALNGLFAAYYVLRKQRDDRSDGLLDSPC